MNLPRVQFTDLEGNEWDIPYKAIAAIGPVDEHDGSKPAVITISPSGMRILVSWEVADPIREVVN